MLEVNNFYDNLINYSIMTLSNILQYRDYDFKYLDE